MVNKAIKTLVPLINNAQGEQSVRQQWPKRLFDALQDDQIPYIETLGEHWGELCCTPELADTWASNLVSTVENVWNQPPETRGCFSGTIACLASLLAPGRYKQLLALLDRAPFNGWHYRRWGVQALVAQGKNTEAIHYAEESRGRNDPGRQIAQMCEAILLSCGLSDAAYQRYAIEANQATTYLASFRAITKKHPNQQPEHVLRDLMASTPGLEGKWFAAAKDAGLYDAAI